MSTQKVNLTGSVASITSTYAGEFAGKYISAALLSGKTLADNAITIKPNVKYKEVVKKVASTNFIADGSCDFTATSDALTLTERVLQPEEFQVNLELCKKDFRDCTCAIAASSNLEIMLIVTFLAMLFPLVIIWYEFKVASEKIDKFNIKLNNTKVQDE